MSKGMEHWMNYFGVLDSKTEEKPNSVIVMWDDQIGVYTQVQSYFLNLKTGARYVHGWLDEAETAGMVIGRKIMRELVTTETHPVRRNNHSIPQLIRDLPEDLYVVSNMDQAASLLEWHQEEFLKKVFERSDEIGLNSIERILKKK